ncbi:MAG: ABC transporter substrate-binding protein [Pyrobaculum sp.]
MSLKYVLIAVIIIVIAAMAVLQLSGPPATTPTPTTPPPTTPTVTPTPPRQIVVNVGCLFDLTGATADVGVAWSQGVKGAFEAINNGELTRLKELGVRINCIERDYGYKIPEAQAAYEFFRQQNVVAIMGWGTGDTLALAPSINKDKIPYFSGSYTVTLTVNPYNFFTAVSYQDAAIAAVRFVKQYFANKGLPPKLALTYPNVPYGLEPLPAIRAEAKRQGVEICAEEIVELVAVSAREQLTRIKTKCGDDVAIWIGGTVAPTIVTLRDMDAVGLDRAIVITNVWGANERLGAALGPLVSKLGNRVYRVTSHLMYDEMKSLANKGIKDAQLFLKYVKATEEPAIRGWHAAYVLALAIEQLVKTGKDVSGPAIKEALETMGPINVPYAASVEFKPGDHRPTMEVWVYVMKPDGTWEKVATITIERPSWDYYGLEIKPVG